MPSPLKSPTAAKGAAFGGKRAASGCRKAARAVPQQDRYVIAPFIGYGEILNAITVEIPHYHEHRLRSGSDRAPVAAVKPPEPLPSKTVMLLSLWFATARSGMPSPLKSPAASAYACRPRRERATSSVGKRAQPFPSSTVTLLLPLFAVARSSMPSPLKSPTTTEDG